MIIYSIIFLNTDMVIKVWRMNAIIMVLTPKECNLLFNGSMSMLVRKSLPKKLSFPFKVYVYRTKDKVGKAIVNEVLNGVYGGGKVIGEFVCDEKHNIQFTGASYMINNDISLTNGIAKQSCLWFDDMFSYLGVKGGVALHITAPKLYDTPKELGEFKKACGFESNCGACKRKKYLQEGGNMRFIGCDKTITRPLQSWCYVEEIEQ